MMILIVLKKHNEYVFPRKLYIIQTKLLSLCILPIYIVHV